MRLAALFAFTVPLGDFLSFSCAHIPLHIYLSLPAGMSVKSAKGGPEGRPSSAARSVIANQKMVEKTGRESIHKFIKF